jgi:hypothetical protein
MPPPGLIIRAGSDAQAGGSGRRDARYTLLSASPMPDGLLSMLIWNLYKTEKQALG